MEIVSRTACVVVVALVTGPFRAAAQPAAQPPDEPPGFYAAEPVLVEYVRAALDHNPDVEAARQQYLAALERVHAVSALPDPVLTFSQALRSVETRVGPQWNTLSLSQAFPWFGTLDLREQVAMQDAAVAYQAYRARQRDLIAEVKKAFYDLSFVDRAIGIANEEQAVLGHYEELAQVRYASGQGLQQAVLKLQAEITRVVNRIETLHQQRDTLAARLNTLMNRPPAQAVADTPEAAVPPGVRLDADALAMRGEAERPDIRSADALIERGERAIDLTHKRFWPDLTVGAALVNVGKRSDPAGMIQPPPDNGRNAFSISVGANVPIGRAKYRADLERATAELSAARLTRAQRYNQMALAVRSQIVRLQTLAEQIRLITDVLLPQTDEALRSTEAAYETGQVGVLDLLDSERGRLDVRLIRARDVADYLTALADLEQAIGAPFPDMTRMP